MHRRPLLVLLAVPLLVTACSAGGASSKSTASAPFARPAAAATQGARSLPAVVPVTRAVVRTAAIDVTVRSTSAAADQATALAARNGGRVDSDTRSDSGKGSATLVLRVPPAAVEPTLTALAKLGKETDRSVSDADVTDSVVDLSSRIATQRASVARVRALLDRAQSLTDITHVESELTRREADLESMLARSQALAGQVDLATLTVHLDGKDRPVPATHHSSIGFSDGLQGGWDTLTGTARVIAVIGGALLPFSWLLLVALVGRLVWRRRVRPTT